MNYKILFILFISCNCNLRSLKKKTLFDETKIKNLKLKNRVFRSSIMDSCMENSHITDEYLKLYDELSKNEIGTILTGAIRVTDYKKIDSKHSMLLDKDEYINEYKKLSDLVHKNGANIIMQLVHSGINTPAKDDKIYGPSVVKLLQQDRNSIEMTKDDILYFENLFIEAAIRAKKAGFDGIELHAAHFFLLSSFISPLFNHRNDEYGGNDENRVRIVIEIVKKIREKLGNDFIIGIKLNTEDGNENGISEKGFLNTCKILENSGVDIIEVSGTNFIKGKHKKPDFYDIASKLADYVNIPVILLGGVRDLESIDFALNNSKIEYIGMARTLLCEPDIVKRWKNGDKKESKCISCFGCMKDLEHPHCIFNKEKNK